MNDYQDYIGAEAAFRSLSAEAEEKKWGPFRVAVAYAGWFLMLLVLGIYLLSPGLWDYLLSPALWERGFWICVWFAGYLVYLILLEVFSRVSRESYETPQFRMLRIQIMALLGSILIYLTGGAESPFWFFYLWSLLASTLYLSWRVTWGIYGEITVLYFLFSLAAVGGIASINYTLLSANLAILLALTVVFRYLVESIRRYQTAEEKADLYGQRAQGLLALTEINRAILAKDIDEFQLITRKAVELTEADHGVLRLVDHSEQSLILEAEFGRESRGEPLPIDDGSFTGWVAFQRRAELSNDVSQDDHFLVWDPDIKSCMAAPLSYGEKLVGTLYVESTRFNAFSENQLVLLQSFADQASVAIENARLYEQRSKDIAALQEINEAITTASWTKIAELIAEKARDLTQAEYGTLWMVGRENYLVMGAMHGREVKYDELPIDEHSIVGWVAKTGKPYRCPDVSEDPHYMEWYEDVKSSIAVPLKFGGRVIGTLIAEGARLDAFSDYQLELLQSLADQAAIAIENTRLFRELDERAKQLLKLQEITATISAEPPQLDSVLHLIVDSLGEMFHEASCAIRLYNSKTDKFLPQVATGLLVDLVTRDPRSKGTSRFVVQKKAPRYLEGDDLSKPPDDGGPAVRKDILEQGVKAAAYLPLLSERDVIGVLYVDLIVPYQFSNNDKQILELFADQAAIAIENSRLHQRSEVLTEIGRTVSNLGVDQILDLVYKQMGKIMDLSDAQVQIAFYDEDKDEVTFPLAMEQVDGIVIDVVRWSKREVQYREEGEAEVVEQFKPRARRDPPGLTEHVIRTKQPLLIAESFEQKAADLGIQVWPTFGRRDRLTHSWLGVPMMVGGRVVGIISTQSLEKERAFDEEQQELLETVASQAAVAIENARLYQKLNRRVKELEVLTEIGRTVSNLGIDQILDLVYEQAAVIMDLSDAQVQIAFYDSDKDEVSFPLAIEQDNSQVIDRVRWSERETQYRMPEEDEVVVQFRSRARGERFGLTEYVIQTREPVLIIEDFVKEAENRGIQVWPTFGRLDRPTHSWLGVPMIVQNRVIGIISIQSLQVEHAFDQGHVDLLTTVASQAAVAIENARLYQALKSAQTKIADTEAELERNRIAADFVHRINNLVGTVPVWIDLSVECLLTPSETRDNQEVIDYLQKIRRDFEDLLRATEELKKEPSEEEVDITFLLGAMLRNIEIQYSSSIAIDTDFEPKLYHVWVIPVELQTAIWNVISNGLEAMPDGGRLTIRAKNCIDVDQKEWVWIEVEDTGIGIPSDKSAAVFELSYTTKGVGRGYGLWRAKNIIERLGGTISFKSETNTGSIFTIMLPVALHRGSKD